jgi:hypothetical protein
MSVSLDNPTASFGVPAGPRSFITHHYHAIFERFTRRARATMTLFSSAQSFHHSKAHDSPRDEPSRRQKNWYRDDRFDLREKCVNKILLVEARKYPLAMCFTRPMNSR